MSSESTGTWFAWNEDRRQDLEIYEAEGDSPVMVQFARAGGTFTRSITVFCTSGGRRVTETAEVVPGEEDLTKAELIRRVCK